LPESSSLDRNTFSASWKAQNTLQSSLKRPFEVGTQSPPQSRRGSKGKPHALFGEVSRFQELFLRVDDCENQNGMVGGRQPAIHAEGDRKLEAARQQRKNRRQRAA
jgi:hypothetical protein